ncbi:hypothetical protein ASAC_1162 [Acidilobus saccharovorans 345-15]|uniref:Integrase catalytic domain-containing protein n=1 Tax=Acidilobus saccharovorans (strain DSM 16705 / JCM 18335 / VKM B-2471 / 345-15) TaxID=666510 RepID=D9Q2M9_ACIS3|nr:DUF460 domain-containing protein [Acidilobus saccharovorans]ADL19567.1 hypothetical protein ASAC_1162 [Acidilobus saccharovorans 345-15]
MSSEGAPQELYMGVDIESGSPLSSTNRAKYSVVIIDQSLKLIAKHQSVPLATIIRLAWEYRPRSIASDNVMELSLDGSTESIARLLSLLPPGTKLVQATATEDGLVDVLEAARRAGIDVASSKLSPMRTAFIVAAVVAKGGGQSVGFSREKTYIVVSRGRNTKSGGWSQARYQRRIRASVKIAADKVKEALDNANIDYDVFYKTSEGGLDSAIFIVYAPREKLIGIVRPHRGIDYSIRIETKYEGELVFGGATSKPSRPLIVGVDAGMTTGLAVLDLEGRVLHLGSYKELDRGKIVSIVSSLGKPVIVTTDVADPPELIRKLAAQLGAQLYLPNYNMSVAEKEYLASRATANSELKPKTPHERDSLAAAYRAFIEYHNKLSQVEAYASKLEFDIDIDELKADVVKGATLAEAVEKQIAKLLGNIDEKYESMNVINRQQVQQPCADSSKVELLEAQKMSLEKQLEDLRQRLFYEERELYLAKKQLKAELLKDDEIRALKGRVSELESSLAKLQGEQEHLQEEIQSLRRVLVDVASGRLVVARRVSELRSSQLKRSEEQLGPISANEVVIVDNVTAFDSNAVEYLSKAGVKAILVNDADSPLANAAKNRRIAPLRVNEYAIIQVAGLYFVSSKVISDAMEFIAKLKSQESSDAALLSLLNEYRAMRGKGSTP